MVVTIEHGVGLGIVLDGKLYRGERGCGAEFGHAQKFSSMVRLCQCGQRGCLEAYVGDYALLREATVDGHRAQFRDGKPCTDIHVQAQFRRSNARRLFWHGPVRCLVLGVSNLINLFDPECIILSGAQMEHGAPVCSEDVMNRIQKRCR